MPISLMPISIIPLSKLSSRNRSFSEEIPGLQVLWDSVSYTKFSECPYKYYLTIIQGIVPLRRSIPLTFGIAFASGVERYHKFRAQSLSHEDALLWTIASVYYRQLRTPTEWLTSNWGHHEESIPVYTNEKKKDRTPRTLTRTLIAYLDHYYAADAASPDEYETLLLEDGTAAAELSFRVQIPGTKFFWCGHLDRPVRRKSSGTLHATDQKTTVSSLDARYFDQYKPCVQFLGYDFASKIIFSTPAKSVIVDAIKVSTLGQEFARETIPYSESQLEEFLKGFLDNMLDAERYAKQNDWPMRLTSCRGPYGDCEFRKDVCSRPPHVRLANLQADFTQRTWDPSKNR